MDDGWKMNWMDGWGGFGRNIYIYKDFLLFRDFFLKVCLFFKCPPQQKRVGIIFVGSFFCGFGDDVGTHRGFSKGVCHYM